MDYKYATGYMWMIMREPCFRSRLKVERGSRIMLAVEMSKQTCQLYMRYVTYLSRMRQINLLV